MLLLGGATNRLSIDIDIICPPGTEIERYLSDFKDFGFTKIDLVERRSPGKNILKVIPNSFTNWHIPTG